MPRKQSVFCQFVEERLKALHMPSSRDNNANKTTTIVELHQSLYDDVAKFMEKEQWASRSTTAK